MYGHTKNSFCIIIFLGCYINELSTRPLMFASCGLYFIVRIKDPGTIPIVKVEIPLENN